MVRPRGVDALALHAALDARRQELGLSWKQLADQVWALSPQLNARRVGRDHPLAATTFMGMARRRRHAARRAS